MYPNWFKQTAQDNFEIYLTELADKPNLMFLQLGAFTGDATVWLMENILTTPKSMLIDVDTWKGSDEDTHKTMDFEDVKKTYLDKTRQYTRRAYFQGTSVDYMLEHRSSEDFGVLNFDFIYIDGDHTASGVLDDAVLGWNLLKSGGILAFDDYTWQSPEGLVYSPKPAIDSFLWTKQGQFELLEVNTQVWVRKI